MRTNDKSLDFTAFDKKYPTNEKCLEKIYKTRWKTGYKCPRCHYNEAWEVTPYKYKCRNCGYQTTVTAGTLFHKTHLSMLKWFKAIYYMSVRREQATAVELQNLVGIGSNKTALSVMNKIKPMLYCTSRKKLSWADNKLNGIVEICEGTIFGGKYSQTDIFVAVETNNGSIGRIRLVNYPKRKDKQKCYMSFVSQLIDKNATIRHSSQQISCPLAQKVSYDFDKWREGKENIELETLCVKYCKMINAYTIHVTFDEILRNTLNDTPPPQRDSTLI